MNRTDVLNHLAATLNLKTYLEIGVRNPADNFDRVKCGDRTGVDPSVGGRYDIFQQTSEEFFATLLPGDRFDLIFIDGDHRFAGVADDIANALRCVTPGGFIVMHDCNPQGEAAVVAEKPSGGGPWNGQAWEVWADTNIAGWPYRACVDVDHGCGVLRQGLTPLEEMTVVSKRHAWQELAANRAQLLNLVTWQEFVAQCQPSAR